MQLASVVQAALELAHAICVEFEGFYAFPYDDLRPWAGRVTRANIHLVQGTVTIGFGETDASFLRPYIDNPSWLLGRQEALDLLMVRVGEHWEPSARYLSTDLNACQLAAWMSVAYNAGPAGIAKWAPETLRAINERRFGDVAHPDRSKKYGWGGLLSTSITRDQSGGVSDGLVRRRASECELFSRLPANSPPADLYQANGRTMLMMAGD